MSKISHNYKLIAGLVSVLSLGTSAKPLLHGEDNFNVDCSVEFQNQINVTKEHIIVIKDDVTIYDIYRDDMVFYKGERLDLNANQLAQIKEFSRQIRHIGPEVTEIALEAVELTIDALTAAFSSFDNDDELDAVLSDLRIELTSKLENDQLEYSYSEGEFNMDVLDSELDQTIEDAVEKILPTIMGSVFQAIGKAMVDGGSSMEELENIGERVEREVELRSKDIEIKADLLCDQIKAIDKIETGLSASHSSLSELDVITVKD